MHHLRYKKKGILFFILLSVFIASGCGPRGEEKLPVTVAVRPSFFSLPTNGRVQLAAEVGGTENTAVRWTLVNGQGKVDPSTGLFEAPSLLIRNQASTTTVQATSRADPTVFSRATLRLTPMFPSDGETVPTAERIIPGSFMAKQSVDINNDGRADLVTSHPNGSVTVSLRAETGGFVGWTISGLSKPVAIAVGDFITEGGSGFFADLAVASAQDNQIHFIQGQGGIAKDAEPKVLAGATLTGFSTPVSALAAGRFHGDPNSPVAVSDLAVGFDRGVSIFSQGETLGFNFTLFQTFPVAGKPIRLLTGHFNQDSFLDLAVILEGRLDIAILLGSREGQFIEVVSFPFSAVPASVAVGDFNKDQISDLVAGSNSNHISVLSGKGDGTFQTAVPIETPAVPGSITVVDFNFNQADDIAILIPGLDELFVLLNDGEGNFIGNVRRRTENAQGTTVDAVDLTSGFFFGFQGGSGAQTVSLAYLTPTKFYFLNNPN